MNVSTRGRDKTCGHNKRDRPRRPVGFPKEETLLISARRFSFLLFPTMDFSSKNRDDHLLLFRRLFPIDSGLVLRVDNVSPLHSGFQ